MRRVTSLIGLAAFFLILFPSLSWAKQPIHISISLKPERPVIGEEVSVDCRLWTENPQGQRERVQGGRLRINISNLTRQVRVHDYFVIPDGQTDIYVIKWRPDAPGVYKITTTYSGTATLTAAQASTRIGVFAAEPPSTTTTTLPSTTTTTTLTTTTIPTTTTTTTTTSQTTTTLTTTTATSTTTTLPAKPVDLPVDGLVATKINLIVEPTGQPGEFFIDVQVTTRAGNAVEEGQVLITVDGGQLEPGYQGQALVSAPAGRNRLFWRAPAGSGGTFRLKAEYFGGEGPGWDYEPSSAEVDLPPPP